jgi:hypothetical protein
MFLHLDMPIHNSNNLPSNANSSPFQIANIKPHGEVRSYEQIPF